MPSSIVCWRNASADLGPFLFDPAALFREQLLGSGAGALEQVGSVPLGPGVRLLERPVALPGDRAALLLELAAQLLGRGLGGVAPRQ